MSTFGERFEKARKAKQISRRELARLSGIHPNTLNRWASGETKNPQPDELQKVAPFLGETYEWLRTGKDTKSSALATLTAGDLTKAAETAEPFSAQLAPALDRNRLIEVLTIVLKEAPNRSAENLATIILSAYDQAVEGKSLDQIREKVRMWFS